LEAQDAWLLMTVRSRDSMETILFLPDRNPQQERWTGIRLGPDTLAARLTGIAKVLPLDSLDRMLQRARFQVRGPAYVPLDVTTKDEQRLKDMVYSGREVKNLRPIVDSMRLVKDADEIARLRLAVYISAQGHIAAMRAAHPGVAEYEIEAAFESEIRR